MKSELVQIQDMGRGESMYTKYVELRDAKGLKDSEIARITKIPQSTFSDWKKGKSKPKLEKLMKLADFFGVPISTFIEGR